MDDKDILSRTLYGEAEANNTRDAIAIACVVVNRMHLANWPDSAAEVCLQSWQFSCWNPNDPNRARILAAKDEKWFLKCQEIADQALQGALGGDITRGSTHYYQSKSKEPFWARGKTPVLIVAHTKGGGHCFYNNIDSSPPKSATEALDQARPLAQTRTVQGATVAASATVLGATGEAVRQIEPALPLLQTIAQFAPLVFAGIALVALGWVLWARFEDRKQGIR
jgi:N-acetylmuramoyl-L-alanine amidase